MKNATPKNLLEVTERIIQGTPVNSREVGAAQIQDYLAQRFQAAYMKHAGQTDVIAALDGLWQIIVYPETVENYTPTGEGDSDV